MTSQRFAECVESEQTDALRKVLFWYKQVYTKKTSTNLAWYDTCNAMDNQRIIQSTPALFHLSRESRM
jgi:hypothetical protein